MNGLHQWVVRGGVIWDLKKGVKNVEETTFANMQGSFAEEEEAFNKYGKKQNIGIQGIKDIARSYLRASGNGYNIKMVEVFEPDKIKDVDYNAMQY